MQKIFDLRVGRYVIIALGGGIAILGGLYMMFYAWKYFFAACDGRSVMCPSWRCVQLCGPICSKGICRCEQKNEKTIQLFEQEQQTREKFHSEQKSCSDYDSF